MATTNGILVPRLHCRRSLVWILSPHEVHLLRVRGLRGQAGQKLRPQLCGLLKQDTVLAILTVGIALYKAYICQGTSALL